MKVLDTNRGQSSIDLWSRKFLLTQLIAWSVLYVVLFAPMHSVASTMGASFGQVVFACQSSAAMAVLFSTAIGWIYLRLPERYLQGGMVIVTILSLCTCFSMVGTGIVLLLSSWSGIGPWLPPGVDSAYVFPAFLMIDGVTTLAAWSAVFLAVLLSKRVHVERERAIVASALAGEARLNLLRSQLNPHFLFNALNSVVGLIKENPAKAEAMIRDIAGLLRRSLDDTKKSDTNFGDEMDFVNLYLRCQKVRFEDQLRVEVDVPGDLLLAKFPSMLLHPLVENAVKHGMRTSNPLRLKISAWREEQRLVFQVSNSGTLRSPGSRENAVGDEQGTGTGVRSVRERIRTIFPDNGSFELREVSGNVVATIAYACEGKNR